MRLAHSTRQIAPLAWPVFVGQISVVAFATVDTLLVGRASQADLAALAVGGAAYITVFIGLMGVVLALGPIVGQLQGAGKAHEAGHQLHQAVWIALGLAAVGSTLLLFPAPFLALARADAEVESRVRSYLAVLACSLPASLLFAAYRGFNVALARPKAVMAIQLAGLALKVPLAALLVWGLPGLGLGGLGVTGAALSTAIVMWLQASIAFVILRRDPFYARFALWGRGLHAPDRRALLAQLRLGLPMGASLLVEVSAFSLLAMLISRFGTVAVAGHQIAANLVSLMFMMPIAVASATSTLVAQAVGARDVPRARRMATHGLALGLLLALALGGTLFLLRGPVVGLYTRDAAVAAAALPLLAWVALFHVADAAQAVASFALRGWRIATLPLLILAGSLWGVGLGGGYLLAVDPLGLAPASLHGAPGYWAGATAGLVCAGLGLTALLARVLAQQKRSVSAAGAAAAG